VPTSTSTKSRRAFETTCGTLGPQGHSVTKNMPFGRFSAGLRHPNQLAAVADWPPYLPDLNSLEFSTSSVLQPKGQATPGANLVFLRPSVAAEWDRLAVVQICRTCRSYAATAKPSLRKMKLKFNRWLALSSAHTNQYFSGLTKTSIRHEGLYIEKTSLVHN
jgi:hypothetical protein